MNKSKFNLQDRVLIKKSVDPKNDNTTGEVVNVEFWTTTWVYLVKYKNSRTETFREDQLEKV